MEPNVLCMSSADRLSQARSRSRSPLNCETKEDLLTAPVLCCVILGGPGSGKSLLGSSLQQRFPGFLGISCGDLARRLTFCDKSPFLNSVAKQLKDRRRRKKAFGRVTEIVIKVVARAVSSGAFWGIIVDGLRDHELPDFEAALGSRYTVLAHLSCPSDVMLSRLSSRQDREGDDRLGLVETDAAGRVQAYLERAPEETKNLRAYAEATSSRAFFDLDATLQVPSLVEDMVARLNAFAKSSGFSLDAQTAQTDTASVDWELHISEVASRLDREFHPDGKPRSKHNAAGCEKAMRRRYLGSVCSWNNRQSGPQGPTSSLQQAAPPGALKTRMAVYFASTSAVQISGLCFR
ncbi:unnamed protein product [Symbiodinium necroappetens]|uniref:UMP-CMP kinase n=1 Tax=Symbiodinium necroappetens TaxID=1628268 RepID=A0A812YIL7_9DINO|nr:unnamed protein product [Symbiodinium necroappetens]